jgi:GNAT superfamily N-acetyltransferase
METSIRTFEAKDQAVVGSLFRAGLTSYGEKGSDANRLQNYFVDLKLAPGGDMNDIYSHYILSDDKNFWVICLNDDEGEKVIGCCGVFTTRLNDEEVSELVRMSVSPEIRSRGLGSQLVKAVENWAKERKHSKIILSTLEIMEKARALYEKNGFLLTKTDDIIIPEHNLSVKVVEYMKEI